MRPLNNTEVLNEEGRKNAAKTWNQFLTSWLAHRYSEDPNDELIKLLTSISRINRHSCFVIRH